MDFEIEWFLTKERLPKHMERVVIQIEGKQYPATFDAERKQLIIKGLPHTAFCALSNSIEWKRV